MLAKYMVRCRRKRPRVPQLTQREAPLPVITATPLYLIPALAYVPATRILTLKCYLPRLRHAVFAYCHTHWELRSIIVAETTLVHARASLEVPI